MELSFWGSGVRLVTECVQSKTAQVLGPLLIFTLSRDVFTTTISEQPNGHPGLNSKADEEGKGMNGAVFRQTEPHVQLEDTLELAQIKLFK